MDQKEKNLKKLAKTPLLMNFVKKNDGKWDHEKWLELCDSLKDKGYYPIDFNQVGILLEKKKKGYLEKKAKKEK